MQTIGRRYCDTIECRLVVLAVGAAIIFLTGIYFYQQYNIYQIMKGFYIEETVKYRYVVEQEILNLNNISSVNFNRYLNPALPPSNYAKIVSWKIFDNQLHLVQASHSDNVPGEPYNIPQGADAFQEDRMVFSSYELNTQKCYGVITPLHGKNQEKVGGLEIIYASISLESHLKKFLLNLHLYESIVLVITFLSLSYFFCKRLILNPLKQFKNNIDQLRQGGSVISLLPIPRHDEIGTLMVSVNGLLNELKSNIEELEGTKQQTQAFSEELKSAYERLEAQITEMKEAKDQITELYIVIEKINVDLDRKVIELSILNEVGRAMSSILDLDQLLNMIIKWATEEMGAKQGEILLQDQKGKMVIQAVYNLDKKLIGKKAEPLDYQKILAGKIEDFVPAITIPLKRKGVTSGIISIGGKESGRNFTPDDLNLLSTLGHQAAIAIENAKLYETIQKGYLDTIQALTLAIEAKDVYTRGHSVRVTDYAMKIAELSNLSPERRENLRYAAILHDIGKIGIQEEIILKSGRLTEEEYNIMKKHPTIGESIIEPIVFLAPVRDIIRSHHEWYDGNGYPDGLKGEGIKLEARILTLADAFDSMTSNRPYRKAMNLEMAIAELEKCSGKQFDPKFAKILVQWLKDNKNVFTS